MGNFGKKIRITVLVYEKSKIKIELNSLNTFLIPAMLFQAE